MGGRSKPGESAVQTREVPGKKKSRKENIQNSSLSRDSKSGAPRGWKLGMKGCGKK